MGQKVGSNPHRQLWEKSVRQPTYRNADPEDNAFLDTARFSEDSEEENASEQQLRRRQRAKQLDQEDPFYKTEKVSREQLLKAESETESSSDDEQVMENCESEQDDDDESETESCSDEGRLSDSESEQDKDDKTCPIPIRPAPDGAAKTLADLEHQDNDFLLGTSRSKEQDEQQAELVRYQRRLYDAALDLRMSLQRPLQIAARFPFGDGFDLLPGDVSEAFSGAVDVIAETLEGLGTIEAGLLNADDTFGMVEEKGFNKKRRGRPDLDAIWEEIDGRFEETRAARESAIDYWNRRTQVAAGGHALTNKKFKALNQSILTQIQSNLSDMEPLRQRAHQNRNKVTVLGITEQSADLYDDTDFYHMLLKDLVSLASANEVAALGRVSRRSSDQPGQKLVDRRASKGRKIRFIIHEKLVNFMAPCSQTAELNFDIDQLFTHLFAT
jgi:protein AATF/BFR2